MNVEITYDEETKKLINETYHFIRSRKRQIRDFFTSDNHTENKEDLMILEAKTQAAINDDILIKHLIRNLTIIQTVRGQVTIHEI